MRRHAMFRAVDAVVIRVSTYPIDLVLPAWPDLNSADPAPLLAWIRQVWPLPGVAEAITAASPDLAAVLSSMCADPTPPGPAHQIRRAGESLMRYLLRWTSRATPFGLFAGVAAATLGPATSVRFGATHTRVTRPDGTWLTDLLTGLETRPELLRQLTVMTNNLGFARGGDWVLPCWPGSGDDPVAEVSIRHTAAVSMVLQEARSPVLFGDLAAKLATESPQTPGEVIESMLTELVGHHILLTSLRPAMTVTDPLAHIRDQLAQAAPSCTVTEPARAATGVRLDCDVTVPPAVIREVEKAADLLVRLAPPRPAWAAYHAAFIDRYGPGAIVPVGELVDPDRGLGYPAGFRGSLSPHDPPATERDAVMAALAHKAAIDGRIEVALDEHLLADLETSRPNGIVPHTELRVGVAAPSLAALQAGNFTLTVLCASRHAGTSVGRFLHLLDDSDRNRIMASYRTLPTSTADAIAVQISSPPLAPRIDGLARTPQLLPVLSLGEHRRPRDGQIDLADLVVTADAHRLILLSRSRGRAIEPLIFNAVDLRHGTHPLARFLCEVSTATAAPCTPLFWGRIADRFAFLPRVRIGRTILSPARWRLTTTDLPATTLPDWVRRFDQLRLARRIPAAVRFGDDDVLIRLDLTDRSHLALLRRHLHRTGTATLIEDTSDDGWIGGRPHEIVVPLASTAPPRPLARRPRADRTWQGPGHLPGASPWLQAHLTGHPHRHTHILTTWLPDLLQEWTYGPADAWWFIRYDIPSPHLRLRFRLHGPDSYGPAAHALGQWAHTLHDAGLLPDLTLGTYRPETGRWGTGAALAAAEAVFAADSAFTIAHLRTTTNVHAATAAGMVDLACAFHSEAGPSWLVEHLDHGRGPALDRAVLTEARHPMNVPADLQQRRRSSITAYRTVLDDGADTDATLADLLHLHHARMIGIDPASERLCLRLARAVAQNLLARKR